MNLLLLDQFSDPGGAQLNLLELLPVLRAADWHALVGMPGNGELFGRIRALGFEAERIACGPYASGRKSARDFARFLTSTPRLARQISRMADRIDADVVYVNGPRLLPAAALAGLNRPVLFHCHSFLGPGTARSLAGRSLRRMDAWVMGQCEFVAAPWRPFVSAERVSVVYNGVAGPKCVPVRRNSGAPRVACIGRIAPEKGQLEFVKVAARIHQAIPDCHFSIYGAPLFGDDGAAHYGERVHAAAEGLPVEFTGWIEHMEPCLAEMDLLLVPSMAHEATTRVILEAYAYGVPVIAFGSGGIPEVVEHGVTGFLASGSKEMADRAIELLSGDGRQRMTMADAARRSWERRFTVNRYCREVMSTLEAANRETAGCAATSESRGRA